jgi:hypothetical protein
MEEYANIGMGCLLKEDVHKGLFYYGGRFQGYYLSLTTKIGLKLKEIQDKEELIESKRYYKIEAIAK